MDKFYVEGGVPLQGQLTPSGNKNEALPVLAATLLTEQTVRLRNVPEILDIATMRELLVSLGARVEPCGDHAYEFEARSILGHAPEFTKAARIRGSFLLAGPMLARFGQISLPVPGGDQIGLRPVQTHLLALRDLGARIDVEGGIYRMTTDGLKGTAIQLDEASVMATENAVMAAVLAEGETEIYNAACEPHVQGLCRLLVRMGAHIDGIGTNCLRIQGVSTLNGADYAIQPDHIEVGSFIGLAAMTRGEICIKDAGVEHLRMVRLMFERLGVTTRIEGNDLWVPGEQDLLVRPDTPGGIPKIDDGPWPAFPADLTSIMTVTATQSRGAVLIFEKMFESRLFWVDKLISMGAQIILCDPHRAVVSGPSPLHAAKVTSPDIRAGMSLLLAALTAQGTTEIGNVSQIDRGYECIEHRLNAVGARIRRVKE